MRKKEKREGERTVDEPVIFIYRAGTKTRWGRT